METVSYSAAFQPVHLNSSTRTMLRSHDERSLRPTQKHIDIDIDCLRPGDAHESVRWDALRIQRRAAHAKCGIAVKGRRYGGEKLADVISRFGRKWVRVLFDDHDPHRIYVDPEDGGPLISLVEVTGHAC